MEMIKKWINKGLAVTALLFLLAACSPGESISDNEIDPTEDEPTEEVSEEEIETEENEEEDESDLSQTEETEEVEESEETEETTENNQDSVERLPLTVYQASDEVTGLEKVDAELIVEEGSSEKEAFEKLLKGQEKGQEHISLLVEGSQINTLQLNADNIVEADLSSEYINNMNAGSTGEQTMLQGLINTFTQYYGVKDILLTIDGAPYESGHFSFKEGETLSFDDSLVNK